MSQKTITWDQWYEKYHPILNETGERIEIDFNDRETLQAAQESNTLWTQLDADGVMCFANGYHHVNRMAYVMTEEPYDPMESIEVVDQSDIEDQEEYEFDDPDDEYDDVFDQDPDLGGTGHGDISYSDADSGL